MSGRFARLCCTVLLPLGLLVVTGCEEKQPGASAAKKEAREWKGRYEKLVRENEETAKSLRKTEEKVSRLRAENKKLENQLESAKSRSKEVAELEDQLDATRKTITDLRARIRDQRQKLSEGPADAEARIAALKTRQEAAAGALETAARELLAAGKHEAARAALAELSELRPEAPMVHYRLAYCHGFLEEPEKAVKSYQKAVEAAQGDPERFSELLPRLYNNYGATLVEMGRYEDALGWYQKAVEADEEYAAVRFNLGRLYGKHLKQPEKAIAEYRRHVALGGERGMSAREAIRQLQNGNDEQDAEEG